MKYPGIRILMVRAHYPELEENIIRPILRWVPEEIYSYNGTSRLMSFDNGSIIKFGHYDGDSAENELTVALTRRNPGGHIGEKSWKAKPFMTTP